MVTPRSGRPLTGPLQTPRVVEGDRPPSARGGTSAWRQAPARAHVIRHVSAGLTWRPRLPLVEDEEEDVAVDDAESVVERSRLAWGVFVKGDPQATFDDLQRRSVLTPLPTG